MSSRQWRSVLFLLVGTLTCFTLATPSFAQDTASGGSSNGTPTALGATQSSPPQTIDILAPPPPGQELDYRPCTKEEEAAKISGEIVVCRARRNDSENAYSSKESAMDRYAAATAFRDAPAPPDPCGPNCGIFSGPATVSNLCIPGLGKCPPPPALFIDVSALPKAPPGSDADRIAHGLAPLGEDDEGRARQVILKQQEKALDLPPPAAVTQEVRGNSSGKKIKAAGEPAPPQADNSATSPAESAEPTGQR
ncbi:hypothetical protein [Qipengyuania algicida]|uniref:hypothetical protein n=1 Tax=Qipengyuania algicida TaxID=1836209 RepID=UPI0019272A4A|nr:hypothetical protein [Qipengyuania algicida]